jgi:hypothetical protein
MHHREQSQRKTQEENVQNTDAGDQGSSAAEACVVLQKDMPASLSILPFAFTDSCYIPSYYLLG